MAKSKLVFLACPTCEPDGDGYYDDLADAVTAYEDAADPGCWRCEGHGLLVGEPDAWEAREGDTVTVKVVP